MFGFIKFEEKFKNINTRIDLYLSSYISYILLSLIITSSLFLSSFKNLEAGVSNRCIELMSEDILFSSKKLIADDSVIFDRAKIIEQKGKYGIISKEGTIIVEPQYDSIILDDDVGLRYIVKKDGKYGLIDFHGRTLINTEYDYLEATGFDIFYLVRKGDKFGTIDVNNKVFIPLIYDGIEVFRHELYKVSLDSKIGIVDAFGNIIVPIQYDDVDIYSEFNFIVKKGNKFGLYVENNLILEPEYEDVKVLSRGYFSFKKDGLVGLVYYGKIILDREYDIISRVNRNLFLVYKDHKFGLVKHIDDEIVFVLDIEYDKIELKDRSWNDLGYSIAADDYHYMEIQTDDGRVIFDRRFYYDRDIVVFKKDDKFGLVKIDYNQKEDEWKVPCIYDYIEVIDRYTFSTSIYSDPVEVDIPMPKYFIMEKDGRSYLLDEDGVVIKEVEDNYMICHWGSLKKKVKKLCRSYMSDEDFKKVEENKAKSFLIVSPDKKIKIFIDERKEE